MRHVILFAVMALVVAGLAPRFYANMNGSAGAAKATAADGTPAVAINVNCLEGVEPRQLKSHHYDGRSK